MVWFSFKIVLLGLVVIFLIQGSARLLVDVIYLTRSMLRALFPSRRALVPSSPGWRELPEKPVAVLVAVPCEAPAVADAIAQFLDSIDYENFRVFVSIHREHKETLRQLEALEKAQSKVHLARMNNEAASGVGACLNRAHRAVREHENLNKVPFDLFVLHDASTELHPLALRCFNHLVPEHPAVQLPIFAVPDVRARLTRGAMLDDLAELYGRSMVVRALVSKSIPLAGTGVGLSRAAVETLTKQGHGKPFDEDSILPTYHAGLRLSECEGKTVLLDEMLPVSTPKATAPCPGKAGHQPLAVLDRLPRSFRDIACERAQRTAAASLQGLHGGWSLHPGTLLFQLRDRLTPLYHLLLLPAFALLIYIAVGAAMGAAEPIPYAETALPLMLAGVLAMWAWQSVMRVATVGRLYGLTHGLLALVHYPIGHFIDLTATLVAAKGVAPTIAHHNPFARQHIELSIPAPEEKGEAEESEDEDEFASRLGDMLLTRTLITREQLKLAMKKQKKSGQKIGQVLVESGSLDEEDLVSVLAHQQDETAIEIDPYATPVEVLSLVPRSLAERYRVFPIGTDEDVVILAVDATGDVPPEEQLSVLLGRPVRFEWTSSIDIGFAIEKAYLRVEEETMDLSNRLGARLIKAGAISDDDLKHALRTQKRTHQRLGEILVEMKLLTEDKLHEFLTPQTEDEPADSVPDASPRNDDQPQQAAS